MTNNHQRKSLTVKDKDKEHQDEDFNEQRTFILYVVMQYAFSPLHDMTLKPWMEQENRNEDKNVILPEIF